MARKITGHLLLVLGVLGLVLPILQGGLFLALGLFVLRDQYAWAARGLDWTRRRWPVAVDRVEEMEGRLIAFGRRQRNRLLRPFGRRDEP